MQRDEEPVAFIAVQMKGILREIGRLLIVSKQIDTAVAHQKQGMPFQAAGKEIISYVEQSINSLLSLACWLFYVAKGRSLLLDFLR